ncbi:MAG: hypothetical protein A2Y03_04080 [Omnitrophica WOR_2 bacterium GWF2_38_59]|nr:MAG: hypothetical protein A2Y03_04080 [Omnitrophica WOR_2 bacterium GWF2_38_59]OGX50178.1 MAG: hypothetical protein A2243_08560 [Omnitrophica WOR_2 bacterium RIFOXYA2_FULL_38_17]HBG60479.1 glycoside hydrolase [Candidatus Omnitrophota bacterium]
MKKFICIHGHFYQPPRENPWLEEVEIQESAFPDHDWNQRITQECYAPNASARILDSRNNIVNIVNNYEKISFNFGPTLLSWMERNEKEAYRAILMADKASQARFNGHGSAMAQCYNHMIMPLANSHDKRTQVIWGLYDFERRYNRKAEGMWLAETAVDLETLDLLAEYGVKYTVLAPHQAKKIRAISKEHKKFEVSNHRGFINIKKNHKGQFGTSTIRAHEWIDVTGSRIDPRRPYLQNLPSGREIVIYFYDGPTSSDVAFGHLLKSGVNLVNRLMSCFSDIGEDQLVHIATDGETYGHHQKMGDMALAYCLNYIEENHLAELTNYGKHCSESPCKYEVDIYENTSWSCCHGIERWRSNCGCCIGSNSSWNQNWRKPLRDSFNWLRDEIGNIYEMHAADLFNDIWQARNNYIEVVNNRSKATVKQFFLNNSKRALNDNQRIAALKLLEMQRHAMLMFTSCGWFFDEVSRIETKQILQYAARTIQLAKDFEKANIEEQFINRLREAKSNLNEYRDCGDMYEKTIKPEILDLVRVGAHYAVSSLFEKYSSDIDIYSYTATSKMCDISEIGKQKLAVGKVLIKSNITYEESMVSYAVLHLGEHRLTGGAREFVDSNTFSEMHRETKEIFLKRDSNRTISFIEKYFAPGHYSLYHLFKDEQTKILYQILDSTLVEIEASLRQINEYHHPIIQIVKQLKIPLPKMLSSTVIVMLNAELLQVLSSESIDFDRLKILAAEIETWSLEIDTVTIGYLVKKRINILMDKLIKTPRKVKIIELVEMLLKILKPLGLTVDLWRCQNIYFLLGKRIYSKIKAKADKGHKSSAAWVEQFKSLGKQLNVNIF